MSKILSPVIKRDTIAQEDICPQLLLLLLLVFPS